jgi:hypothetical protein
MPGHWMIHLNSGKFLTKQRIPEGGKVIIWLTSPVRRAGKLTEAKSAKCPGPQ